MAIGRCTEAVLRQAAIRVFVGEIYQQGVPRHLIGGIFGVHGSDPGDITVHKVNNGGE
ncbi:hypothetical protein [Methanoculleus sp.]|uniref:hypothetical protein n=1 Tax=Methanoculleus sp. TaxID=90427 RepID=UPI002FC5864C